MLGACVLVAVLAVVAGSLSFLAVNRAECVHQLRWAGAQSAGSANVQIHVLLVLGLMAALGALDGYSLNLTVVVLFGCLAHLQFSSALLTVTMRPFPRDSRFATFGLEIDVLFERAKSDQSFVIRARLSMTILAWDAKIKPVVTL